MKKIYTLLLLFCSCVSLGVAQQTSMDQLKSDYQQVNTYWKNQQYTNILNLINGRLSNDANDVLGLSLKQFYYVFVEYDITNAHAAANKLKNFVDASPRTELKDFTEEFTKAVTDIPVEQKSISQAGMNKMHQLFPDEFPNALQALGLALSFYHP